MKQDAKILIVEDVLLLQLTITRMLESMGFSNFKKTTTGTEAIALAKEEHFDFILMDVMLKDHVDGIEAYRQIKEKCGEIPVIYITGNTDLKNRNKASQFGYHAYLGKPISYEQLEKSIRELFPQC